MSKGCIYIVDDDLAMRDSLEMLLTAHGYDAKLFRDGNEFLHAAQFLPFGVLIVDLQMPGMDGLEMLDRLKSRKIRFPVVVITGFGNISIAVKAMRVGATDFVMKPWHNERLIGTIRAALATPRPHLPPPEPTDLNLDRSEKTLIVQALNRHAHNISLAAKDLGLTRAALYRRMEKHGL